MFTISKYDFNNSNILEMMETITVILCVFLMVFPVSILWMAGIEHMKKNHPDYKGEDFLDEE